MPNPQLKSYIDAKRKEGLSDDQIRSNLLSVGWDRAIVDMALAGDDIPLPPSLDQVHVSTNTEETMWSAFQNILTFISLGFFAGALHALWSTFVDYWLPNSSEASYYSSIRSYIVNPALAALFVSAPFFIGLFFITNSRYARNPELKKAKSKKVLNYLTLIITFLILLSRLVSAVSTALNNLVTLNFIANLVVTLIIVGSIFAYYLYEVRVEKGVASSTLYALIGIILIIVTFSTAIAGLYLREVNKPAPKPNVTKPIVKPPKQEVTKVTQGKLLEKSITRVRIATTPDGNSSAYYTLNQNNNYDDINIGDCVALTYKVPGGTITSITKQEVVNNECTYGTLNTN